ncbi:hypothetical protein [Marinobacter sp.]|uniref:hypothetical protein n=1 Tax=Marinobacter sp. TaxID=50741 RepID=UPI002B268F7A|nr:hypothetical protein [Marinobacter sp.]
MMHGRKYFMPWMLIALCFAPACNAHEHPEEIKIASSIDVPITAATANLLQQAYQRLGVNMKTLNTPSRRALMMANKGLLDGDLFRIGQVVLNYPNLIRVDYPLLHGELRAVVRPGSGHLFSHPSARPKTAAVRLGVIIAEQTAKAMGIDPIQTNSYEQARTLLESGRVDIALVSDIEGFGPLALKSWEELEILPSPVATFRLYHYLNERHEALAKALPDILGAIEKEGIRSAILSRFRQQQRKWNKENIQPMLQGQFQSKMTRSH